MDEVEQVFPRWDYTIDKAANELGTTPDYLLHLGATDRAELMVRFDAKCSPSLCIGKIED